MMSDQNPHPGDIGHSQIPVGLTLIGALPRSIAGVNTERVVAHRHRT